MSVQIEYAGTCFQGLVRKNNEDNFWCDNEYLSCENHGLDEVFSGRLQRTGCPAFAVFDGMGGEECGEVAAFLAADTFHHIFGNRPGNKSGEDSSEYSFGEDSSPKFENSSENSFGKRSGKNMKENLNSIKSNDEDVRLLCQQMNDEICRYAAENRIRSMGCTAALLLFDDSDVYAANVGDSSIFCFQNHRLKKVSVDHVCSSPLYRKPPLTQFLGIPPEEMLLSPHIQRMEAAGGMQFLLCSDGLTDLFEEREIEAALDEAGTLSQAVQYLKEETLRRGALDNTTIILCGL
ncbi:MAG: serine/threonine-protein phosphatase [Lachnospiraceae bacterium]|nr:serine/threonine-protein phosphatase [Lachnospiraceae bacterium]